MAGNSRTRKAGRLTRVVLLASVATVSPAAALAIRAQPQTTGVVRAQTDSVASQIRSALGGGVPDGISVAAWERTRRVYATFGDTLLWPVAGVRRGLAPRAATLVRTIASSAAEGLRPADYPLAEIARLANAVQQNGAGDASEARLDILLTGTLSAFASDRLRGRVSPRSVEPAWHIDPERVNVDSAVVATIRDRDLSAALNRLRPRTEGYDALVAGLARYQQFVRRGGWAELPAGPVLRPGDRSPRVLAVRRRLAAEDFRIMDHHEPGTDDDLYDAGLARAVAAFQTRHGLTIDSIVGPRTRAALNVSAARREQQIAANLERLRWLPPRLGDRYVVVNIPAFRLDAYDHGQRALSMPVIVGADYGHRATPIFSDSMRYVVFNPYWNVPASIAVREILPDARRDADFLARNGYEIVKGWSQQRVHPAVLRDDDFRSYRYRVRQRPGRGNALGRVKFIFPNDYNVYLHDTPLGELFSSARRAFSHGCIRVAEPAALAEFVLGPQGVTPAAIDRLLAGNVRQEIDLARAVPVFIVYLTAFAGDDGSVMFREDLYDRDDALVRALRPEPFTITHHAAPGRRAGGRS